MKTQSLTKLLLATAILTVTGASAADYWPQFRGPNGAGISESAKERIAATPALVEKTIYVRSAENLWAFGK